MRAPAALCAAKCDEPYPPVRRGKSCDKRGVGNALEHGEARAPTVRGRPLHTRSSEGTQQQRIKIVDVSDAFVAGRRRALFTALFRQIACITSIVTQKTVHKAP